MIQLRGNVDFTSRWLAKNLGVEFSNPYIDPVTSIKRGIEISRKLYDKFPRLPIGNPNPKPGFSYSPGIRVPYWDRNRLIPMIYGAPEPVWNPETNCEWHSREKFAWDWVKTMRDVENIKIPRWKDAPLIKELLRKREVLKAAFPESKIQLYPPITWKNDYGEAFMCIGNSPFIDLTPHLVGTTRFFRMLISEPEFAHALLEKCFEMSTSYIDFLMRVERFDIKDVDGLMSLGGDYTSTLSPRLFAEYGNGWNKMVIDHFKKIANRSGDPPCSIHSCGPSAHLYEEFSKIPNVIGIETRGVVSGIEKLREALPKAHLNITFAPPQVNFEKISPEDVRSIMWKFVEGAGFRDISLHALCPAETPDENVRAFYKTLQEINNSI